MEPLTIASIAWTFLKDNWKPILIGGAIIASLSYVGVLKYEVTHYKAKAEAAQAEIVKAKAEQKIETERRQAEADRITKAHADTLRNRGAAIMQAHTATLKRIKAHEASKRIVLERDVVELFNATTGTSQEPAAEAKPADVREASPTAVTLNHLLEVSAVNNANHLKCVAQVLEWQGFWEEYARASGRTDRAP